MRKTKENVKIVEDDKRYGIEIGYKDGPSDEFGFIKEDADDEYNSDGKRHYDELKDCIEHYGDDRYLTGYKNGNNDGFNAAVLATGISGIVGFVIFKILDWRKEKKNEK